jgi:SulP family sulfate permease
MNMRDSTSALIDSFKPDWRMLVPPLLGEMRGYSREKLRRDAVAAATVAMVSIPQAVGFALIAGLPPTMVFGCVVVGGFIAALFFSSRFVVFGPSNSLSMLLAAAFLAQQGTTLGPAELAVLLAVMIGFVQFVAGVFRFGQITQFVSRSVVLGYGAAIGMLLILSQVHHLLGIARPASTSLIGSLAETGQRVLAREFNLYSLVVATAAFLIFWLIKRLLPRWPEALIGLVALSAASWWLQWETLGIRTLGEGGALFSGLPDFSGLPIGLSELQTVRSLIGPAVAIALLGMLEAVSIAKTYGVRSGDRTDINRELVAMGLGNLASACFGSMPGSASFARSAANFQAGARTQLSGALSSLMVLGIGLILAPLVNHLPIPALAAALLRIGWRMIDFEQSRIAMRSTKADAFVLFGTFAAAMLLPLDTAIYTGIGLSLAMALRKASTPFLVEYTFNESDQLAQLDDKKRRPHPQIAIIHVEGELFFGAADLFQEHVREQAEREDLRVVVLRLKNARHLDATTVFALRGLQDWLSRTGRHMIISGVHGEVLRVLRQSGLLDRLGIDNVFPAELNPNLATRKALIRAKQLLGTGSGEAEVRLYFDRPEAVPAS